MMKKALTLLTTGTLCACASVSTPVLRHETADALEFGKFRAGVGLETSHQYAFAPLASAASGVTQDGSLFVGNHLGLFGTAGFFGGTELQLRSYFSVGGGGWRASVKYQALKMASLSAALLVGYGKYTGTGTQALATTTGSSGSTGTVDVVQTLAARQIDFGPVVSYKIGTTSIYGGATYYANQLTGVVDTTAVSSKFEELGFNLGVRIGLGAYDLDVEGAMAPIKDAVSGASNSTLFFGIAGGINF
jgi:hypothetical protein